MSRTCKCLGRKAWLEDCGTVLDTTIFWIKSELSLTISTEFPEKMPCVAITYTPTAPCFLRVYTEKKISFLIAISLFMQSDKNCNLILEYPLQIELFTAYIMNKRQLHILFNSAKTWHVIENWKKYGVVSYSLSCM